MAKNVNDKELEKAIQKFKAHYNSDTLPICDTCGTNDQVIPCILGKPTNDMLIYAQAGHAQLMGCMRRPNQPTARCKRCNVFTEKPIGPMKKNVAKDL